jgi:hypothetical protein
VQESNAAARTSTLIDTSPRSGYPALVTEDTIVEQQEPTGTDAGDSDNSVGETAPQALSEGYFAKLHARFMATAGGVSIAEYVQEVADAAGGRTPQLPPTHNEH